MGSEKIRLREGELLLAIRQASGERMSGKR